MPILLQTTWLLNLGNLTDSHTIVQLSYRLILITTKHQNYQIHVQYQYSCVALLRRCLSRLDETIFYDKKKKEEKHAFTWI
jgi:hypothetical protein